MSRLHRLGGFAIVTLLATSVLTTLTPAQPAAAAAVVYNGAGSAPRIGIVGDSAFAGIRVANTFDPLKGFNFVYDAEACRRTVLASCSAGGGAPTNALTTLRQRSGQWGSLLVMATGYNDPGSNFDDAVDAVMAEAARQGIPKVMWLTLRTAPMTFVPATYRSTSSTFRDNNSILLQKAQQYGGRLQIADWAGQTGNRSGWFSSDGIHFNGAGARGAAEFIASQARRVLGGETITPSRGGSAPPASLWTILRYGMGGTSVATLQQALIDAGVRVRGGVDGVFSIWTVYAVQTFQRGQRLHPNGIVDETTARRLGMLSPTWNSFGLGARGGSVTKVQQALIDRGIYLRGGATGDFTIWTFYAVQTFQRRQGLRANGIVDGATARALGLFTAPEPSAAWTALSMGSSGTNVARAQRALIGHGVSVSGGATGTFTIWTYYAVNTFQRSGGLRVTGVIDVETAKALGLFDLANPVATWSNLALGSAGPAVATAEQALANRGVRVVDGVDGFFKLGDYYAVNTFQRYNLLRVTGVIDMATADRLGLFDPQPTMLVLAAAAAPFPELDPTSTTTTTTTTSTSTTTSSTTSTTPTATPAEPDGSGSGPMAIGGHVWVDADADGIEDPTELRVPGVVVRIFDDGGVAVGRDVADDNGQFAFVGLAPGTYVIEAGVPEAHEVSPADQIAPGLAGDVDPDDVDSDFVTIDIDTGTARTAPIALTTEGIGDVGLGLVPIPTATETGPTSTMIVSTSTTDNSTVPTSSDDAPTPTEPPGTAPPTTDGQPATTQPAITLPETPATTPPPLSTVVPPTTSAAPPSTG